MTDARDVPALLRSIYESEDRIYVVFTPRRFSRPPPATAKDHSQRGGTWRLGPISAKVLIMTDSDHGDRLAYLAAVVGPTALGAALYPARGHIAVANLALVFVVAIVAVASMGRRGAAVLTALMSAISFDYFCTSPYLSLRITRSADLTTELLLLVVGLAVGELAARGRRARRQAEAGHERRRGCTVWASALPLVRTRTLSSWL